MTEDLRRTKLKAGLAQLTRDQLIVLRDTPREQICLDTCNYDEKTDTY